MQNQLTNDIVQQLLRLPYDQRGRLANTLIDSLHPGGDSVSREEWNATWMEECCRRMSEIDSGQVEMVSADELVKRMREKRRG